MSVHIQQVTFSACRRESVEKLVTGMEVPVGEVFIQEKKVQCCPNHNIYVPR